jgi:Mg-chelatase subunit ChlI
MTDPQLALVLCAIDPQLGVYVEPADRLRISRARRTVARVSVNPPLVTRIQELCAALKVDDPRPPLAIIHAAKALAAFEGRLRVAVDDIRRVAPLALGHLVDPASIGPTFDQILAGGLPKTA